MSSSTPERRTEPTVPTEPTEPERPGAERSGTSRFRPPGSDAPTTSTPTTSANPVTNPNTNPVTNPVPSPISRPSAGSTARERGDTAAFARPHAGPGSGGLTGGASSAEWEDPEDVGPERVRHVVDRFDGAAGLLLLRLVTAVILAVRGLQKLQHLDVTRGQFAQIGIPYPDTMAVVVGGAEFAIAFALIIGAFVRLAGLGIAIITIGALVYVKWRTGDIFTAGQPGFNGELELLLAGVGLALLGLGGGGWGVDRRFRRR